MKQKMTNEDRNETKIGAAIGNLCRACSGRVLAQIKRAREVILAESAEILKGQRHAVRLALNEAEALAWQTMFPHLLFPILAEEKVKAVADWNARQQKVRRTKSQFALAA